jgi:hypothetical protein
MPELPPASLLLQLDIHAGGGQGELDPLGRRDDLRVVEEYET